LVYGAGYIGLELACFLQHMGVDVTVAYRSKTAILRGFDQGLAAWGKDQMTKKGLTFEGGVSLDDITPATDSSVSLNGKTYDRLIMAIGREPYTHDLGLETVGIKPEKNGTIQVDKFSQTIAPHIWAIGDVTGRLTLTPVALYEAMCLVETLYSGTPKAPQYESIPTAVFCQPEMASVGLTEEQAIDLGKPVLVFEADFKPLKYTLGQTTARVFMKVLVDQATDVVLGVHMGGESAGEIIQSVAIAVKARLKKSDFDGVLGIHPTSAEELVTLRTPSRTIGGSV
jgi:glutathione reductase (NADPH)